jgi:hypothetical protein
MLLTRLFEVNPCFKIPSDFQQYPAKTAKKESSGDLKPGTFQF